MKNILLTIEYDGTEFCGWQRQPNQRSVQGEIERVLSVICGVPVQINGTSRTDAGVHAYGQRANFMGDFSIPTERIPMVANALFAAAASGRGGKNSKISGDIRIRTAEEVPVEFHARFNSVGKKYIYMINTKEQPDIFRRNYCYQTGQKLDIERMQEAAQHIIGTHDFKCFQAAGGKEMESTVRTIHGLKISEKGDMKIEVIGDGFLYNMVRIITGTLVEVGLGKMCPRELPIIIKTQDRQKAGHTAPPQGLYLSEVYYEEEKMLKACKKTNKKENDDEN